MLNNDSIYMDGLIKMASYKMAPSYSKTICFNKKDYIQAFKKTYKLQEKMVLEEIKEPLQEFFEKLMNIDKKASDALVHWITIDYGKINKIYTLKNDNAFNTVTRFSPFYFLENIYFLEFDKIVICIMIGNDE